VAVRMNPNCTQGIEIDAAHSADRDCGYAIEAWRLRCSRQVDDGILPTASNDHMAYDGLHDVFTDQPMGALTEQRNDVDQFTRAEQDEFAAQSHQKAAASWKDGVYADEVVPVQIPQRKGDPLEFAEDEGVRADTTAESLAGLKPAFRKDGTITAGSASQISDGAAAVW
jgi:acetyl-CoA acetyltransferase